MYSVFKGWQFTWPEVSIHFHNSISGQTDSGSWGGILEKEKKQWFCSCWLCLKNKQILLQQNTGFLPFWWKQHQHVLSPFLCLHFPIFSAWSHSPAPFPEPCRAHQSCRQQGWVLCSPLDTSSDLPGDQGSRCLEPWAEQVCFELCHVGRYCRAAKGGIVIAKLQEALWIPSRRAALKAGTPKGTHLLQKCSFGYSSPLYI